MEISNINRAISRFHSFIRENEDTVRTFLKVDREEVYGILEQDDNYDGHAREFLRCRDLKVTQALHETSMLTTTLADNFHCHFSTF